MPGSDAARRYGNRGGGWLPAPARVPSGSLGPFTPPAEWSTHPDDIARRRAHGRRPCVIAPGTPCVCRPDPADLAEVWSGRARMAAARRDAGRPLDDIDRQALRRLDTT
jgi:hypothetical protein